MTVREEGKRGDLTSVGNLTKFQEILEQGGISENTAHVWQKVARVPEDKFERVKIYGEEIVARLRESLDTSQSTIWRAIQFAKKYPELDKTASDFP